MRKPVRRVLVVATFVVVGMIATQGAAFADEDPIQDPFLCPAVGNQTAANANGNFGELTDGKYTFLPGNNQAGVNANHHALNPQNPAPGNVPGNGHSDWSPIWPGDFFD
jgi:hypothetical protein